MADKEKIFDPCLKNDHSSCSRRYTTGNVRISVWWCACYCHGLERMHKCHECGEELPGPDGTAEVVIGNQHVQVHAECYLANQDKYQLA